MVGYLPSDGGRSVTFRLQIDVVEWHSLRYWWCSLLPFLGHHDIVIMTQVVPHEGKVGI